MHISDQKDEWRDSMKERLLRLSDDDRAAESRSICRRLLPLIPEGSHVAAYMALKTEPDLSMLIDALVERGDHVYLPAFEQNKMTLRKYTSRKDLAEGSLKILEPPRTASEANPEDVSIALVPGRAFDRRGKRLGRGNGGYDKWIEKQRTQNPETQYWGICFECQVVNELPTEGHDEPMDKVVTAHGIVGDNS